jgi:hypothetical protein
MLRQSATDPARTSVDADELDTSGSVRTVKVNLPQFD